MENPNEVISRAPLPTEKTLRQRKNILIQLRRFLAINIKVQAQCTGCTSINYPGSDITVSTSNQTICNPKIERKYP